MSQTLHKGGASFSAKVGLTAIDLLARISSCRSGGITAVFDTALIEGEKGDPTRFRHGDFVININGLSLSYWRVNEDLTLSKMTVE